MSFAKMISASIVVFAAVALINLWEAAKCRGAVAMRWDGQRWVVSIAGKWEDAKEW